MTDLTLHWRKSTFSGQGGECVELARHHDGRVLVRNSNHPDAGTVGMTPSQLGAWLHRCGAGDIDELGL
jgi:hypothetical protein